MTRLVLVTVLISTMANLPAFGDERPNIVLLMGDDHGWDETGYNGHPHLKTPVLDDMAANGLRLDRFFSAHPTCSPTRGSVMTGRHPNRYGTLTPNYSIRPEEITIARLLNKAGYRCGHFGKWHLGPVKKSSPTSPGAMGFHEWLSHDNFFELNPTFSRNGEPPTKFAGESSEIVIQETTKFLQQSIAAKQPFFAVVWFGSPHEPYSGLAKDLALYDDLPAEYADKTFKLTSNKTGRPTKRPLRDVLRERYAEITAMDRSIGQLRTWLSENGQRDNTLIWYCGDNGTPGDGIVTSPYRGRKGNLYDGGIRVPGVIEWPAGIQHKVSMLDSVTSDILPTLCDIAGVDRPDRTLDGISLKQLFDGEMTERPTPICFWAFPTKNEEKNKPWIEAELQKGTTPLVKMMGDIHTRNFRNFHHPKITDADFGGTRAIVDGEFKLIVSGVGDNSQSQLFAIRKDPGEKQDIASTNTETANRLQQRLRRWQSSVLDSLSGKDYPSNRN